MVSVKDLCCRLRFVLSVQDLGWLKKKQRL